MQNIKTDKTPFFGKTKKLIDSTPFMEGNKFLETWIICQYFFGFRVTQNKIETVKIIDNTNISNTNSTFSYLKSSGDFLSVLLENLNSCILLLNKDNKLIAFNNALKNIFTNKKDEHLLYYRCGEALGCANHIDEMKDCGSTSHCSRCQFREAIIETYQSGKCVFKEPTVRYFFDKNGNKIKKHLQFSTHVFKFYKDKYVILLIEDISKFFSPSAITES